MALDAWTRELGTKQGRIVPAGWTPPAGTMAFVLGFDDPGQFEMLNIGDFVEVSQTATFLAGTKVARVTVRLRPPVTMPTGHRWRFSIRIGGVERAFQFVDPGKTRDRLTLAVNVSKLVGAQTLAFRLALEAA